MSSLPLTPATSPQTVASEQAEPKVVVYTGLRPDVIANEVTLAPPARAGEQSLKLFDYINR